MVPQVLAIQPYLHRVSVIYGEPVEYEAYTTRTLDPVAFSRRTGDPRNGVWLANLGQGDSLDTKYDCSRFHAICFIVASCNGRLYLSSVKRTGWEPYDRKNKMGYLRRSWKVNGLSVYGPVRPVCHHGMFLLFPRGFVAIECYVGRSDFPRLSKVL